MTMTKERAAAIREFKLLIGEVAGALTPWEVIEAKVSVLPVRVLTAINYRIERALEESYEAGQRGR